MPRESNKRGGKSTIEAQEEQECTESEMKSYFESLSKKLDAMNSNQEKRHVEMCTRFEALERNTSQLASDLKSLKEKFKTLEGDLADVKVQVENKVDETQNLKGRLMIYKTAHVETTWCFGMFQRAVKMVCL